MKKLGFTKANVVLVIAITGLMMGFTTSLDAQTPNSGERVMFIQIQNLNPDEFQKIAHTFKDNDQLNVKQACVPAEVIMFSVPSSNTLSLDENFNRVKGSVLENTTLTSVSILAEYSEEDFIDRCKMFRSGEQDQ